MHRDLDPVETWLQEWAHYMRSGHAGRGYKSESGPFIASWIKHEDEIYDAAFLAQVKEVDTCIHDLLTPHRQMIYQTHNIGYTMLRWGNPEQVLKDAMAALKVKMQQKSLI